MFKFNITIFQNGRKLKSEYYAAGKDRFLAYLNLWGSLNETSPYPFIIEDP